ncbi:Scramblase [Penicillium cf. griseofulvum]|uniref:Scramblase n=1 Tax=Penicillium cf. griseofulvum TaxID=2972120 RepID=A0A9W9MFU7_9EURO|nr:Scramblase [Penicillium cf. griseofulvum]KAJ5442048.1 Scramblase [Penicillium cf. griseofulvum]KAJ5450979.1 Scramblase [Penicillium cf. griseofulvum]
MWGLRLQFLQKQWTPARTRALSSFRSHASPRGPRSSIKRPNPIPSRKAEPSHQPELSAPESQDAMVPNYDPSQNTLLSPVHLPEDPRGVLKENHPSISILANSGIVVQRQLEMMNILIGFEQANKYVIMDALGNHIGYMAEQDKGLVNTMARQWFHTHRSFVTHVFDRHENEVLRFNRPFSWINSRIHVYDPLDKTPNASSASTSLQSTTPGSLIEPGARSSARISPLSLGEMRVIGEAQQQWAPLRRKYNLFTHHQSPNPETDMGTHDVSPSDPSLSRAQQMELVRRSDQTQGQFNQFAYVDEPFLSWDFSLKSADNQLIGSVNRNFAGFAREIFTDTGVYAMRMDSAALGTQTSPSNKGSGMTLDQRAVMLATAVSIDFDYFSRQHSHGGLGMPLPLMGGQAPAGAATGGAASGEVGAVGGAASGTLERVGTAGGMPNGMVGGATTAGAMAGYEAMHRGSTIDPNAPTSEQVNQSPQSFQDEPEDPWGKDDPWGDGGGDIGDGGDGGDYFDW